ncbi:MAG: heme ABC transporter permease CcmC [Candidatus Limnocylindrales bacterium]
MTAPARPRFGLRLPGTLVGPVVAIALATALLGVPADATQGDVQRIMYIHVPSAWLAYLAFFVTMAAGLGYLVRRDARFDRVAVSSAEIGVVFTGLAIATGAIWGRPTWGRWWDWDPRLTTTAVLFLVYVGYLLLRSVVADPDRRARVAAVIGLVGFLNVPIVHFSVLWWRSLHQPPTVIRPGDPSIDPVLLAQLLYSVVAFTLLYLWLLGQRVALERLEADLWPRPDGTP